MPRIHWPFALALALLLAVGANNIQEALTDWHLHDMEVYRSAARRILAGEPLYGGDVTTFDAYRYAPWWAYAWIPLALLPDGMVNAGWSTLMLLASAACIWAIKGWRMENVGAIAFFGPILFGISAIGNVQPLMIAALVYGLPRRWGWVAVGLAGSLKIVPLAYCTVFIAERRWWSVAGAVLLAVLLWLPALWMSIDPIVWDAGPTRVLPVPLWLTVALLAAMTALALAWTRSKWTGLAAGTAAILALPRIFMYEVALLLPAAASRSDQEAEDGRPVQRRPAGPSLRSDEPA